MSFNVGIIGTGYVGLVSGITFAATGNRVFCLDIDEEKIEMLKKGISPIFEPGLDVLLKQVLNEGMIKFTCNLEETVIGCKLIFLCLPTPPNEDGSADLSRVLDVTEKIATIIKDKNITERKIIINKSTVPVGTAEKSRAIFDRIIPGVEIDVVSNPEFLREGYAIDDSMKPDRIVIGTSSKYAEKILLDLYQPFVRSGNPIYIMNEKSSEVTKYAANSFLATKISFMNDLSDYCERVGVDIESVRIGIGSDSRIGKRFLFAGVGFGGSCFPKDVRALLHSANEAGAPLSIVQAANEVNYKQSNRFFELISKRFNNNLAGKRFAVWGLAFKPNTDDVREAPAFRIIDKLLENGAEVNAYDPQAIDNTKKVYGNKINYATSKYEALNSADALLIITEWNTFRNPDFDEIKSALSEPVIFDGRNLFDLEEMSNMEFEYYSIGRKYVNSKINIQ
jgi:UDPglucose 6-dehydrogenase